MAKRIIERATRSRGRPAHDNWLYVLYIEALAKRSGKSINSVFENMRYTKLAVSGGVSVQKERASVATLKRRFYTARGLILKRHPVPESYTSLHPRSYGPYIDDQINQLAADM